jgi:hypothetical protein
MSLKMKALLAATSLIRPKITAAEVADVFAQGIRDDIARGQTNKLFIEEVDPNNLETVRQEWFYFDVFNTDYVIFAAFGQSPVKKAILDEFWRQMKEMLGTTEVPPIPERGGPYAGEIKVIPPENWELAWNRLLRRCRTYQEVMNNPHPNGEAHGVALTFGILCGDWNFTHTAGVGAYFQKRTSEWIKMVRSYRIVY